MGEEIWVRFFFFSWRGGGGGGGVLGVLIGGSELEWEMRRTGWGGSTECIMHRVHTSSFYSIHVGTNNALVPIFSEGLKCRLKKFCHLFESINEIQSNLRSINQSTFLVFCIFNKLSKHITIFLAMMLNLMGANKIT